LPFSLNRAISSRMSLEPLTPIEARVLGSLLEKSVTTPEYYPLTLNSLEAACNQKTSRDPIMNLGEHEVLEALDALRARGWALRVDVAGSRVPKFRHSVRDKWELDAAATALLTTLLLRGAQTAGQLKQRCERMHVFRDLAEVVATLEALMDRPEEPHALVAALPHLPGSRETRYRHTLLPEEAFGVVSGPAEQIVPLAEQPPRQSPQSAELEALRAEVLSLRADLDELRATLDAFRSQFD